MSATAPAATAVVRLARRAGVQLCLANPGTSELALVRALDAVDGVRPVLGLHETVCAGAADGAWRAGGVPALVVLHLGPGLGNAAANLHNARRAGSGVLAVVGDHATWHQPYDPPLASDAASLARAVADVVLEPRDGPGLVAAAAEGLRQAAAGRVVVLLAPSDAQEHLVDDAVVDAQQVAPAPPREPDAAVVDGTAQALRGAGQRGLLLLGGDAAGADGLRAAARVAAATGCRVLLETFPARQARGGGLPAVPRLPYLPEAARPVLAGTSTLVLAGAVDPVTFFGYEGEPSRLAPAGCAVVPLHDAARAGRRGARAAVVALADALDAPADAVPEDLRPGPAPEVPAGQPLHAGTLGPLLAAVQPEGCVVVDEAATSGLAYAAAASAAPSHDVLALTGGAIGYGLPAAAGAALAAPGRRVLALQADGSGLYSPQALWTLAREGLDVTVAVMANAAYRILQVELARGGTSTDGAAARGLTDLSGPAVDWVRLAEAFGVPARRAEDTGAAAVALRESLAQPGPSLVELTVQ